MDRERAMVLLRRVVLPIVITIAVVILLITLAINIVLTDGRLRPIIHDYAEEYLDAEVSIGKAEGVFFRTFPHVGIRMSDCSITTNAFHRSVAEQGDTVQTNDVESYSRRDTLLTADDVIVGISLMDYLFERSITLSLVALDRPVVRLITDSLARNSWDILRPIEKDVNDTTASIPFSIGSLLMRNARIVYYDRPLLTLFMADSLTIKADGNIALDNTDMELELETRKVSFAKDGTRYLRRLPLSFRGDVFFDGEKNEYRLEETYLTVATTDLNVDGLIRPENDGAYIDVSYGLKSPSAKRLFEILPQDMISTPIEIKNGAVQLDGTVCGFAGNGNMPIIHCNANIEKIRAQYKGRNKEIEDLTAHFSLYLNKAERDSSYANLDIFHFKGGKSEVEATVLATQLLSDALLNCNIKAHIELGDMMRVVPLKNTTMNGILDADIKTHFRLSDIDNKNIGRIKASGFFTADSMRIENDAIGLQLLINAKANVEEGERTGLKGYATSIRLKTPTTRIFVKDYMIDALVCTERDTSKVQPLYSKTTIGGALVKLDSISIFAKDMTLIDRIDPTPSNPRRPTVSHDLTVARTFARANGIDATMQDLSIGGKQTPAADTSWHTMGHLSYNLIEAKLPKYMKALRSRDMKAVLNDTLLTVESCLFEVGQSKVSAKATIADLLLSLKQRKPFTINLNVEADTLNFNELLGAVVTDTAVTMTSQAVSPMGVDTTMTIKNVDSLHVETEKMTQRQLIPVPNYARLNIRAKANTVVWDNLTLSDARSGIKTNDGALHMTNFMFRIGTTRAMSTLAYKAWPRAGKALVNVSTQWSKADIGELVTFMGMDSIIPALKPMRGILDCAIGAELELDSTMNVKMESIKASAHLSGQNITVLENEQFNMIAKKLFFKNKKRNIIDTLSINLLIDDGNIQVLPFAVNMDRYRMAIGGSQDFNMNMKYHVSVLKSPLPFKIGVNIDGTPDNFETDITTAKLKKLVTPEQLAQNDTIAQRLRNVVICNSYLLSNIPMPEMLQRLIGTTEQNSRFAIDIKEAEETEEELREIEKARQMMETEGDGTINVTDSTVIVVPTDTIAQ